MQSRWQQDAADGFAVLVRLLSEAKCLTVVRAVIAKGGW
jgi:hypothetical protein